ncbi:unnamed protein product [Adineta steineri]|uniref:Uncharacterized protein n=1 Tax=Adineta steineri TaxID=433720 RepID=A0A815QKT8_9BILA|nr:unnamed protein product [Adineta steineri]CAF1633944.1 unnamed protein product [Adineta steineri]
MVSSKVIHWLTAIASILLSGLFYLFSRMKCLHPHCVETYAKDSITILYTFYLLFIVITTLLCKLIPQLPFKIRYWLEKDLPTSLCLGWFQGSLLELLTLFAVLGLIIVNFIFYWSLMLSVSNDLLTEKDYWNAALMGSGHMGDVLLGLLLIPLGRHSFLSSLLDIHIDSALRFHKRCGTLFCLISILHGFVIWTKVTRFLNPPSYFYWTFNIGVQGQKWIFYVSNAGFMTTFGFIAGIALSIIWIFSFSIIRRRLYNLFYIIHILFGPLMIISASFHTSSIWYYCMPGAFLLSIDWIIRLYNYRKQRKGLIRREECGYLRIDIFDKIDFNLASFIMIKIEELGYQISHPFTIANDANEDYLVLLIKPSLLTLKWTNRLAKLLPSECLSKEITVRIDGSFGFLKFQISKMNLVACFVGGIGISGALAIVSHILKRDSGPSLVFIFWAAREANAEKLSVLQQLMNRQDSRLHIYLFGHAANFLFYHKIKNKDETVTMEEERNISETLRYDIQTNGIKGSLERMIPDDLLQQIVLPCVTTSENIGIYTCGPKSLMDSVQKACENARKRANIYLHRESFEW